MFYGRRLTWFSSACTRAVIAGDNLAPAKPPCPEPGVHISSWLYLHYMEGHSTGSNVGLWAANIVLVTINNIIFKYTVHTCSHFDCAVKISTDDFLEETFRCSFQTPP